LRFHCITLPGGRRLLTFTNVTDFAQRIDELEVLRGAIDNVDQGIVVLDRDLRVRFVNKKARELWRLKPEQCDNWPSFAHFLYDIAATGIYDVPEGKLEDYVLLRYTTVQSGNPAPMDVRIQGGRIIRAQCTALPCDGRMLTHTDVTDLVQRADFHEQQSMLDPLTGLPNRRSFLALAEAEWERFNRYHQPFSLIAFDLDSLKAINDGLGHEAGDRAIRQIARVCNAEKRCSDVVARLGGDEFVILMPGTTADVAHSFADRLRMSIASQPLLPENARLTVSMGVAEAIAETDGVTGLLKVADDRLYAAKRKGRGLSAAADLSLTPELAEPASDEPRTVN
jgi:diguanylate cyclase (GGDEF)-like protein